MPADIATASQSPRRARSSSKGTSILARRQHTLDVAHAMIEELGYEKFTIGELAKRAGVAERNLYYQFGNREAIITSAIYKFYEDFSVDQRLSEGPLTTLPARLQQQVDRLTRNLHLKPYVTALMAIYNSAGADRSVRQVIREIAVVDAITFYDHLADSHLLEPHITARRHVDMLVTVTYAVLSSWCLDEISDQELVDTAIELELGLMIGATRGNCRLQAARWLKKVREDDPKWQALRTKAVTAVNQAVRGIL